MRSDATRAAALARIAAAAGLLACAACQDYLVRRDTLSAGSGDAVRRNAAIHVIDPAPPRAAFVEPTTSGARLQHAIENYRNPGAGNAPGGLPLVPVGPAVAPPPVPPTVR